LCAHSWRCLSGCVWPPGQQEVFENVSLALRIRGVRAGGQITGADALKTVNLRHKADSYPGGFREENSSALS